MFKSTRTRLSLVTLERRETPSAVELSNLPAEPPAKISYISEPGHGQSDRATNVGTELVQMGFTIVESGSNRERCEELATTTISMRPTTAIDYQDYLKRLKLGK